jgi:hypothetical protein
MSIFTRQGITSGNEAIFLKGNLAEGLNGSLLSLSNRYYSVPKVFVQILLREEQEYTKLSAIKTHTVGLYILIYK